MKSATKQNTITPLPLPFKERSDDLVINTHRYNSRPLSYVRRQIFGHQREVECIRETPDLKRVVTLTVRQLRHLFVIVRRHGVGHLRDAPVNQLVLLVAASNLDLSPRRAVVQHVPDAEAVQVSARTFGEKQVRFRIHQPNALVAVPEQAVGGQREVVLRDDLVLVAEVRHPDEVVVRDLPTGARLQVHHLAEVDGIDWRNLHLRDHVVEVPTRHCGIIQVQPTIDV